MVKIVETFYEKELKKTNQEEFGIEKVIKLYQNKISYMSNGKAMIIHSIVGLIKNYASKVMQQKQI